MFSQLDWRSIVQSMVLLFRIVCRIGEYLGINAPQNSISTFKNNPMMVSLQKLMVKQFPPDFMKEISSTMGHKDRFTLSSRDEI
jgi:hypothetical protein